MAEKNTFENKTSAFFKISFLPIAIARLLPSTLLVIITILFARKLNKQDYGAFQTLWVYFNILNTIIGSGIVAIILSSNLNSITQAFKKYKIQIVSFYLLFIAILYFIAFKTIPNLNNPIKIALIIFSLLQVILSVIDALLIKLEKIKLYTYASIIYSVCFFLIHLYFYVTELNLIVLVYCLIALSIFKLFLINYIKIPNTDTQIVNEHLLFKNWIFISLTAIISIVATWLDKIFIQFKMSSEQFAIYFNGAMELPFLGILVGAMETILLRNISAKEKNKSAAKEIFKESINLLSIITIPLFFCFITIYKEVFAVVYSNSYNESGYIFLIYLFLIPLRITHFGSILQCYHKSHLVTLGAFLDFLLSFSLMLILYPIYGVLGVAFAVVFSTYFQIFFYLYHSAKVLNTSILSLLPLKNLMKKVLLNMAIFITIYLVKTNFENITILISTLFITVLIISYYSYQYWKNLKQNNTVLL